MSSPDKAVAVTRGRKARAGTKPAVKKGNDTGQVREIVRAQFQEAAAKGQDIDALKGSLARRFGDPAALSVIEEEYGAAKARMGKGGGASLGQQGEASKKQEQPKDAQGGGSDAVKGDEQAVQGGAQETKGEAAQGGGSDAVKGGEQGQEGGEKTDGGKTGEAAKGGEKAGEQKGQKEPQGVKQGGQTGGGKGGAAAGHGKKGEAGKGGEPKGKPPALQDIALAASPGKDGKLPSFNESLGIDLQKYASEKAWHDAWNLHGQQNMGGQMPQKPGVSLGDRAALVGKALGKGALGGVVRGLGEFAISLAIEQGSKKIPYLSGFVEIAQIAYDPKGWFNANWDATAGKLSKGWSDAFGAGKDWVTRLEGIINLIDGVANVIGVLGTICQVVAAALFVGGLILSIFGVGAALLAAAPFFGKAGLILSEISSLIKLGTMGLRTIVMAGRAFQILADGDADPATLQKRAESLEKNTEEWTKEFTKAKAKKLSDKWSGKGSNSKKEAGAGAADANKASAPKGGGQQTPEEPKGYGARIKSLAGKVINVATGGQGAEFGKKAGNIQKAWNQDLGSYSERRKELEAQVQQTKANARQSVQDKGILRGGIEALSGAYKDAKSAVTYEDRTTKARQEAEQQEQKAKQLEAKQRQMEQQLHDKEAQLKDTEARASKNERLNQEAQEELADARTRLKAAENALNSKGTGTAGQFIEKREEFYQAQVKYQRAEANAKMTQADLERSRLEAQNLKSDLTSLKDQYSSTSAELQQSRTGLSAAQNTLSGAETRQKFAEGTASKTVLGNYLKDKVKQFADKDKVDMSQQGWSPLPELPNGPGLGIGVGNEESWKKEQEQKQNDEVKKKVEELQNQYISIPSKLPEPPIQDEAQVDRQATTYAELSEQIGQIEFQKKTLQDMDQDAEKEKTGLDVLNKLAEANRAQTEALKQDSQTKQAAVQQQEQEAGKLEQAGTDMKSGPGAKTGEYVPFLGKLASLLGMVPKKMASNAGEGIAGAQRASNAVGELGKTANSSTQAAQGAKKQVSEQKQVIDQSNQKVAGSETKQQQIMAQQLAAQAELMEGKAFIKQGLNLADQKKAEKEAQKAQAQAEYQAAKKRLLEWALLHEQLRKGEQTALDTSLKDTEQTVSSGQ